MLLFSLLEKDEKTYNYSKKYLTFLRENNNNCILMFENKLQFDELEEHFKLNCITEECRNYEAQLWIQKFADRYRRYLNSIKILTMMIDVKEEDYTFDYFSNLVDRYNSAKNNIIDSIY